MKKERKLVFKTKEGISVLEPRYASKYSAGFDVYPHFQYSKSYVLPKNGVQMIGTGLYIDHEKSENIEDCALLVLSKSGLAFNKRIVVFNSPGLIDTDYKDEIKILLYSQWGSQVITSTTSIAQLMLIELGINRNMVFLNKESKGLNPISSDKERNGGFGSTGF